MPLLSRKPALERACERMAIIAGGSAPWASKTFKEHLEAFAEVDGGQCHDQSQAANSSQPFSPLASRLPTGDLARRKPQLMGISRQVGAKQGRAAPAGQPARGLSAQSRPSTCSGACFAALFGPESDFCSDAMGPKVPPLTLPPEGSYQAWLQLSPKAFGFRMF